MRRHRLLPLALLALAADPAAARDRNAHVSPYIELGQVLTDDFTTGDVLTYSTIAAGVDADIQSRNLNGQVSYRYERRIAYSKRVGDDDIHSGLARINARVAPGVTIEAGALATRARADIRGAAPANLAGNVNNISQVYAAYAGPSVSTQVGPASVNASYRFGYTKVTTPDGPTAPAGAPRLDRFDESHSHVANLSVGTRPGDALPVGVTASAQWQRDEASQLDQRHDDKYARADVIAPVAPTVALTAGVGYEKIEISQRDAVLDAAGNPVTDASGRFVTDPGSPRRIAYQTDGLIYDAGVIWRPNPRTSLQATVGKRYGGVSYTGSFSYAGRRGLSVQVAVYDAVDTFGHQLEKGIAGLPTSFIDQRDAFGQQFSGCTFGASGQAGGCLTGIFQSIATSGYRSRGVDGTLSAERGRMTFGIGAGYAQRNFFAPAGPANFTVNGVSDSSYYAQAFVSAKLTRVSGITADIFGNVYDSGIADAGSVTSIGATTSYYHYFGRLGATATLGLYSFSQDDGPSQTSGQAQVAMRYQF